MFDLFELTLFKELLCSVYFGKGFTANFEELIQSV